MGGLLEKERQKRAEARLYREMRKLDKPISERIKDDKAKQKGQK